MITGQQVRRARTLLGWTCETLAERSHQSVLDVARIERGAMFDNLDFARQSIQRACEAAGVEFTNGDQPGVRMKAPKP